MVGPLPDWKTRAEWKGEGEALEVRKGTQKLHQAILVAVLWPYVLHFQASRVGFHRDLLGFILHHSHRSFCVLRCFYWRPGWPGALDPPPSFSQAEITGVCWDWFSIGIFHPVFSRSCSLLSVYICIRGQPNNHFIIKKISYNPNADIYGILQQL